MTISERRSIAVLLLNLGGPDSIESVKPFLFNLFSDREIIRLGLSFMQKPLAYLISSLRAKKTEDTYKLIGGKSPLITITMAQAQALEESLNLESGVRNENKAFKVYVGMRYWHPFIEDIVRQMHKDSINKILALSLYPQYSIATTGSTFKKFEEAVKKIYQVQNTRSSVNTTNLEKQIKDSSVSAYSILPTAYCITSWFRHPSYINALVDIIQRGLESFKIKTATGTQNSEPNIHVLFSAHSLPVEFVKDGDPYVDQVKGTIREITEKIEIRWDLSYQSKSGPVKWLEPSTDKMIEELAHKGIKNLLVVPISFVSDHIETLYEIDILYKKMAEGLGMTLERTESLNTSPLFIKALKDIVLEGLKEAGWEG